MIRRSFGGWVGAAALAFATVACSQTDPGITTKVKAKLAADDTVKAYRIDVDTKDKVVTLSGEVDTAGAKARAVELARDTEGVQSVVDNTMIKAGVTPPGGMDDAAQAKVGEEAREAKPGAENAAEATGDAAITAKVKSKFLADTSIAGLKIDVDTTNNVVTLSGTVTSAAERARAVSVAKGTDGVKSVVNKLKVGT